VSSVVVEAIPTSWASVRVPTTTALALPARSQAEASSRPRPSTTNAAPKAPTSNINVVG
jgi:hypothetical protein